MSKSKGQLGVSVSNTENHNNYYRSFGELAFLCMGRPSVFIINGTITFGTSLILIMYALLFSNLSKKLLFLTVLDDSDREVSCK